MVPSVSIVITCHNYARFLPDAVLSARFQTLNGVEIVVVDDGSTDASAETAEALGVRVIRQENRGPGGARNRGAAKTTGEWIAFLDADDLWDTHKLEHQYAAVADLPNVVLCHTDGVLLHGDGTEERRSRRYLPPELGCPLAHILPESRIWLSSAIVRRDAFFRVGGYAETLRGYEDVDLWFRLAALGDFLFLPARLVKKRVHGTNLRTHGRELWEGSFEVLRDRVLTNWDILTTRFPARERRCFHRLLRLRLALCYSAYGDSLCSEGHRFAALGAHLHAIRRYPWSPTLYARFFRALLLPR